MSDVFFSAGDYFSQLYPYKLCPLEISVQDIFFMKSPITPRKSNGRPLKSTKHLLSWQILICKSFLKAFEATADKNL